MLYNMSNIPDYIKNIPKGAQRLFVDEFNKNYNETGNDESARIAGWSNVKRKYKKVDDNWTKKTLSVCIDNIVSYNNLSDDILDLPGGLPYVWMKLFNNMVNKEISVPIARKNAWKCIKKYVFLDKVGDWKFKRLELPEKILLNERRRNILERKVKFLTSSLNEEHKPMFKMIIPVDGKTLRKAENGKYQISGIASATWVDHQDDAVSPEFIKKMNETSIGLNVFVDHKNDTEHLIGHIVDIVKNEDDLFIPIVELEEPYIPEENADGNRHVAKIINRLKKGIKLGFSIGGYATKVVKLFNDELKKHINHLLDGEIYELSVVPTAALPKSDISLVTKNIKNSLFKTYETIDDVDDDFRKFLENKNIDDISSDVMIKHLSDDSVIDDFWFHFDRSVEKYSDIIKKQKPIGEIVIDDLPDKCFAKNGRKYPYKYIDEDKHVVHLELLDKSFKESYIDGDFEVMKNLNGIREKLGLGEKEFEVIDFRKLLVSTLSDVVDAKQARFRLYDILDEFHWAIDDVMYSSSNADEKVDDIRKLGEQLADEIKSLSEVMSHEVLVAVKSLNINEE